MLVDTHVIIWLFQGDKKLGPQSRNAIDKATASGDLLLSAISIWEIAMLAQKGRLTLGRDARQWIDEMLSSKGLRLVPLLPEISITSTCLPNGFNSDPADNIIVATARHIGVTLVSADKKILDYAELGYLDAIDAAR